MIRVMRAALAALFCVCATVAWGGASPASPSIFSGIGALTAVPTGSTNGTALGAAPAGTRAVRFYLPVGSSVTFTVAASAPGAPPVTFSISASSTGPNWDEPLYGQAIYVTATTGSPMFRWL